MVCKKSIKISDNGMQFLNKLRTNRRKAEVDEKDSSLWELIEIIVKYFKNNNEEYLKLVKLKLENVRKS